MRSRPLRRTHAPPIVRTGNHFTAWCDSHGAPALPADVATVAAYLAACADSFKLSTIERRLVSISKAHQLAGAPNPAKTEQIHLVMSGIRRALGRAQTQKAPAVTEIIRAMLDTLGSGAGASRDRAILLIGFAGAFRRSELVALDIADLQFTPAGVVITLRRSKTHQEGRGMSKGIPMGLFPATCPVRALRVWIEPLSS
jgi:site-specific recombinase XerD